MWVNYSLHSGQIGDTALKFSQKIHQIITEHMDDEKFQ